MVKNSYVVLVTNNFSQQKDFYQFTLNLDQIFMHDQAIGLGKEKQLYLILRLEENSDSHHQKENKGPIIITFQFTLADEISLLNKIKNSKYKIRGSREFADYGSKYYFIEDADGNEVCLEFSDNCALTI